MADPVLRLLIAERETLIARRIKEHLGYAGVECDIVNTGKQLKQYLDEMGPPTFILIDLLLPELSPLELLTYIKSKPDLARIKVLVTSSHNSMKNVKQVFQAGACDYLVKPFRVEDVLSRLIFQLQKSSPNLELKPIETKSLESGAHYLQLAELLVKEAASHRNPREKLYSLVQMLSMIMKSVRSSVIQTDMVKFEGAVIASSDDIRVRNIKIDLTKYPEVLHTVNTDRTTTIENLEFNPNLAKLKKIVKTISFNSIIVTPIRIKGEVFGVLSVRMDSRALKFSEHQIRLCQIVADICALLINSVEFVSYLEVKKGSSEVA